MPIGAVCYFILYWPLLRSVSCQPTTGFFLTNYFLFFFPCWFTD